MTSFRKLLRLSLAVCTVAHGAAGEDSVLLMLPRVPILIDAQEAPPVQRAAQNLQRDLAKVFGEESPIVNQSEQLAGKTALVICGAGAETSLWRDPHLKGAEAHAVFCRRSPQGDRIILQGTDVRGCIYAIYSFCDLVLDIPPLWFWIGWKPAARTAIRLSPTMDYRFASPSVAYRSIFLNDTDMLTAWTKANGNRYGAEVIETMLRLKFNTLNQGGGRNVEARDQGMVIASSGLRQFSGWDHYWKIVKKQDPPELLLANEKYAQLAN